MNQTVLEYQSEERLKEIENRLGRLEQGFKELQRQLEIGSSEPKTFTIEVE